MKPIVTLTLNPSIDSSCQAENVQPTRKVRTFDERYDPGGGGLNAARVIRELGGEAFAVYMAGGLTGEVLDHLVENAGISHRRIHIQELTRVSHIVRERATGLEYRFTPEGPAVRDDEWRACCTALAEIDFDYVIASGSLPRGVPEDFYCRIIELATDKGARVVLDTSGAALRSALRRGVYLAKPSLGELESVVGRSLREPAAQEEAAQELVAQGAVDILTVTLGQDGALLVTADQCLRLAAPAVEAISAVGAGDSFVAAMTLGLAQGRSPEEAFMLAVAAGTATVLTPGTELCRRADVERLFRQLTELV